MREVDRSPIELTAEWVVRRFTTHPPTYVWHAEWRVRVAIRGPLNVRLILLSRVGDTVSWGKFHNSPAAFDVTEPIETEPDGHPHDSAWDTLGGRPDSPRLGTIVPIRRLATGGWNRAFVALAASDTETLRSRRWRPRLDLDSPELEQFRNGMRGTLPVSNTTVPD